jgi:cobalt/nickel transport system permease protein
LIIGLCEGGLTFAVIAYLRRVRPELMGLDPSAQPATARGPGFGVVVASLLVTALLLSGVISWFASSLPDGLEWSYREHRYGTAEQAVDNRSPAVAAVDRWQSKWSPLTDYNRRETPLGQVPAAGTAESASGWPQPDGWGSLAGILGTAVTLGLVYGVSRWMRRTARA